MKLTFKTLQKTTFKVDIELDKTVKELKETIEKEQGKDHPVASQKLIYNGKILADENKLTEYEFDEKKFIVLMITRPPPAPKPPTSTSTDSTASAATASKPKAEEKAKPSTTRQQQQQQQTSTTTPATTTVSPTPSTTTSTTIPTTPATTQSRNDPRSGLESFLAPAALGELSALSMGEPQLAARLAQFMSQPHFRQMQDMIQQNPQLLSSTVESLAASDPDMYSLIQENPDLFVNALNHPPLASMRTGNPAGARPTAARGGSQQAVGVGGGSQPVMDQLLGDVSEHDKAAIERLKELGFSEYLAVQAYMACDKDEQLAANLLFQMDQ